MAAASPHRATFIDAVDHLERELKRLKVDVNLAACIDVDDLPEIRGLADHVVLATGSRPPDLEPALAGRPAATVDDAIMGRVVDLGSRRALVYDEGDGFWSAYSAAEALAHQGWQVTLATALTALAHRVPAESAGPLLSRLGALGVELRVAHRSRSPTTAPRRSPCIPRSAVPTSSSRTC